MHHGKCGKPSWDRQAADLEAKEGTNQYVAYTSCGKTPYPEHSLGNKTQKANRQ